MNTFIVRTLERGTSSNRSRSGRSGQPPARLRHDLKGAADMEKTFETPGGVRLYVDNQVGLVAITASSDGEDRRVDRGGHAGGGGARRAGHRRVPAAAGRHVVVVKVPHLHGMRFLRRNAVTVRVEMPEGSRGHGGHGLGRHRRSTGPVGEADVTTASGDISTDDVAADVTAKTASGNITMGAVGGDIRAHTASGGPALLERGGRRHLLHRVGRPRGRGGRQPGGGQGDLGQRPPGRARTRGPGRQRVGRRACPRPGRGHAARPLRLG